jgi:hypothetical protein
LNRPEKRFFMNLFGMRFALLTMASKFIVGGPGMNKERLHFKKYLQLLLALAVVTFLGAPLRAQSMPSQANKPVQDNDTTRKDLAQFDQFMDGHREISEQLRKNPSLVNNEEFVKQHPALQTYLQEHPGVSEEIRENPNAFMRQENRFDRREDARDKDTTVKDLAQFDQFLDGHREIAEQLRKNPSLVNDKQFVQEHPVLQTYLQQHPGVSEEIRENPNAFMRQENRFDRREDARDKDTTVKDLAQFDQFLDGHREIAEQLRKNPSLVNNKQFVQEHPVLQTYLQQHPGVSEEIRENPNAFMRQENRFDRREDARDADAARRDNDNGRRDNDAERRDNDNGRGDNDAMRRDDNRRRDNDTERRDNDTTRRELARFDQFADSHREIAEQLRKDPSLVNDREFVENHPALQTYLQDHPGIRQEMQENPNAFMRQEDRFDRHEDARGSGATREHLASFGEFLGGHSDVARQVSKDPSLVKNDDFVRKHPDFQDFLNTHPAIRDEMRQDPQSFVKTAQQLNINNSTAPKLTPAPTGDSTKPKL